ncbi:WD40-repeat-containing domain protein [Suillus lakei]|nr:WD40-repeat-containing domain protein [Suillus lakei]
MSERWLEFGVQVNSNTEIDRPDYSNELWLLDSLQGEEASAAAQWEELILKYRFDGHKDSIWSFVFLHDNVHIVSGSGDGTMRKWNCDTGLLIGKPWKGEGGMIYALALSPDGKIIACGRSNGSVQRWNTGGKMIEGIWTGHRKEVQSLSWSPSGSQIASGSEDGTILIRNTESGKVEVGPIETVKEGWVECLAYSPSGDRIASGGYNKTICIWDTNTGRLVVGPIKGLGNTVMSVMWSSDSTKLYSASDNFARVLDSKTGQVLRRLEHDNILYSVALSPKNNVLACVANNGVAQLWDTESLQPLGQPFSQEDNGLPLCVSFSQDEKYVAYGGSDNKLTLWMTKDIAPQLAAPTLLQQSDRQSTQQETRSLSLSSSLDVGTFTFDCMSFLLTALLQVDATGGDGIMDHGHDDPYNPNFFQSSHQSLPSVSPGSHILHLFLPRRLLNIFSRHRPPAEETMQPNQPVPDVKVRDGEKNVDDHGSANDPLNTGKDKGKKRDDSPARAQSPPSDDRTPTTDLDSQNFWERLIPARGQKHTPGSLYSSARAANAPKPIPRQPWHWNSSLFPVRSFIPRINVAACRDDDRYGIAPESDAEAAAAMQRTNDDLVDRSTRPGQPAGGAQVSQGGPTQAQASASGPEEIEPPLAPATTTPSECPLTLGSSNFMHRPTELTPSPHIYVLSIRYYYPHPSSSAFTSLRQPPTLRVSYRHFPAPGSPFLSSCPSTLDSISYPHVAVAPKIHNINCHVTRLPLRRSSPCPGPMKSTTPVPALLSSTPKHSAFAHSACLNAKARQITQALDRRTQRKLVRSSVCLIYTLAAIL